MKKLKKAMLILAIPVVLTACEEAYAPEIKEDTSLAQEADDPAENAQEEQEAKEDIERQAKEAAAVAEDQAQMQGYREEVFLEQGRTAMIGMMNVEFSQADKTYYLYPTDPMIIDEIHNLVVYGYGMENWDYMVASLVELSEAAQQVVGDGYNIMFMNPVNAENVLVIVQDGQVIYDAADEL